MVGAKGMDIRGFSIRFSSGGVFHYRPADGSKMWVKFVYSEISAPDKIVYTSVFSDDEGNIIRAPFDTNWPLEIRNIITLTEGENKTTLNMVVTPVTPTEKEIKTFEDSKEMAQEGYSGTFDQLEEYLKKV